MRCRDHRESSSGSAHEHQQRGENGRQTALQPTRRAGADQLTHDESEIEATQHESARASGCSCGRADAYGACPPCHRGARTSVRSSHRSSGAVRVVHASGGDCHRPVPARPAPPTSRGGLGPARRCTTGYRPRRGPPSSGCCDTPCRRPVRPVPVLAVPLRVFDLLGRGRHRFDDRRRMAPVSRSTACAALSDASGRLSSS